MPANTATFPTGSAVPLPRKKPSGGAGPANSAKSFLSRAFNAKRVLKATPLKPAIDWYDRVEDPVGELKKAVKIAVQDRVLFSTLGPYFREHPIYGVTQLAINAPKKIFDLTREVWNLNTSWGFEKQTVPKFTDEQWKEIINPLAQNRIQDSDQLGRLIIKIDSRTQDRILENGKLKRLIIKDDAGGRLKLAYDRRINFWGLFDVPGSQGKGGIKATTLLTPKVGAGSWRAAGTVVEIVKSGGVGYLLSLINPVLAPLPILLNKRLLSHLGWESQSGIYLDKLGLPLLDNQTRHVPGLKVLTEDGREWVLAAHPFAPSSIRSRARVFRGRFAPVLNRVAKASRGLYMARQYLTLNSAELRNFGWVRELGKVDPKTGQITATIAERTGRLSQLGRSLFYLHPRNWINGEAFKKLGFAEKLVLSAGGEPLKWLTKLNPRKGFEWAQYIYSLRHFFSRNPRDLSEFGWQRSRAVEGKLFIRPTRFAQFSRALFYLHPRNWLYGNETWKRLGWPEYLAKGKFRRVARTIYELHPVTLWRNIKEGLPNNWRLLRTLGPGGYLRLKRVDFDNWVSLSDNYLAGGFRKLRPGFRKIYQDLEGRYAKFVLFNPLVDRLRLRRRELGKVAGGLRNGLGKAAGALKGWLLAAKKKSDDLWKTLIAIPLKFLLDLIIKLLKDVALWVAEKVGPYLSRFGGFLSKLVPQGVKELFAKFGAKIGESLVGELLSKIGAQLAGKALLGVSLRFIGNVIVKGAFEAFAWVTAPEIQILSYAWRGAQFLFSKLLWQPAKWLVQQGATRLLTSLGERLLGQGVSATWRAVFSQLGSRVGSLFLQYAWRPLVGWLSGSVWPAVTGFITTTLPAWAAAAGEAIGAALSALMASLAGMVALSMLIIAGILVIVGIFYKITEFISNPTAKDVGRGPVVLSLTVAVDPKDVNGGGTNRIPNLDGKDHLVEFFLKARNDAEKKALNLQLLVEAPLNKSLSLDELGPATEKEFDKFGTMVNAGSARAETYIVSGTVIIDGKTYDLATVGTLTLGASLAGRPCGWPANGALLSRFSDPWHSCMSGEQTCSGALIRAFAYEQDQIVISPLQSEGVVSNLQFGADGGIMNIKSLDDHFEVGLVHLAKSSVVPDPATGLTARFGLKIGSRVTHGQQVAETYFGEIGRSHTTNLFYQVKLDGDDKDPETYAPPPTRGTFFPYEVTRGTTCP